MSLSTDKNDISIRPATSTDIPFLPGIESSASAIFKSIPALSFIASDSPLSTEDLESFLASKHLWVAAYKDPSSRSIPVAFLAARPIQTSNADSSNPGSNHLYIAESSVHSSYQRRGIARKLIVFVENYARENKFDGMTLITFLDVPWNGGFYQTLGFVEVDAEHLGEDYITMLKEEREKWKDLGTWRRGAMLKRF
jgi:ribosomal protein S18 acetylase RimI-like enzyme